MSSADKSNSIIEDIKHVLFDVNNNPQQSADGTEHYMKFVTWAGDGHSFIVTQDGKEYRVSVNEEPS